MWHNELHLLRSGETETGSVFAMVLHGLVLSETAMGSCIEAIWRGPLYSDFHGRSVSCRRQWGLGDFAPPSSSTNGAVGGNSRTYLGAVGLQLVVPPSCRPCRGLCLLPPPCARLLSSPEGVGLPLVRYFMQGQSSSSSSRV